MPPKPITKADQDGKIYAIGGLAGDASLTTAEVFDPVTNTWSSNTPLSVGRCWFTLTR